MEKLTKALMTDETGQAIVTKLIALSGQMHELAMATRGSAILFESESDISVLGDGGYLAVYVGSTNPLVISGWTGDNSLVTGHLYYFIKSGTAVASKDLGEYGGTAVTDTTLSISGSPADSKAVGDAIALKADDSDITALDTRVTGVEDALGDSDDALDAISQGTKNLLVFKNQNNSHRGLEFSSYYPSRVAITGTSSDTNSTGTFLLDKPISMEANTDYVLSFVGVTFTSGLTPVIYLYNNNSSVAYANASTVRNYVTFNVGSATLVNKILIRYTADGATVNLDALLQFEKESAPTEYISPVSAKDLVLSNAVSNINGHLEDFVENTELFDRTNLIDPSGISYDYRVTGTGAVGNAGDYYCGTGMIPVEKGELYCFHGTASYELGGYFGEGATLAPGTSAISLVEFFTPVSGTGYAFQVPDNDSIKYVSVVLRALNRGVNGTYQLEKGEMSTDIVPFSKVYIKPDLIKGGGGETGTIGGVDLLPIPTYNHNLIDKISSFRDHWAKKDKDLMVAGTGTSLTARGSEHCTTRADATSRPPLLDSNNFASLIWDRIKWDGQYYRRYDYDDFFTETGTFTTANSNSDWDDSNYRNSLTRYASGSASVQYTIPAEAWQCNFIYRTDTVGTTEATVTISEGNGKIVVWDGTAWVEANGYTFSMKETPTILPSVNIPDPLTYEDNRDITVTNYQVGGNTTYQKRLKMKAVTRTATKTITISSSSGRFMYWGVEWSVREYMITYVNSARGSHNMTVTSDRALQHFQDNELWSFKPDLVFTENPIHNSGGSGQALGFAAYYSSYWHDVTYDFFFNASNPVSLISRADANGIDTDSLEWIIFNTSISWNFHGIAEDGTLDVKPDKNGRMITALDAQMMSQDYITSTDKAVSINACKYWVDAGIKLFGDLKSATEGSGKSGNTFTNEGSHWNNTGSKVMARCIGGVFDFYN